MIFEFWNQVMTFVFGTIYVCSRKSVNLKITLVCVWILLMCNKRRW